MGILGGNNSIVGTCIPVQVGNVTVDGGNVTVQWPTDPFPVTINGNVTIDPDQIITLVNASTNINFAPLIEVMRGFVVAWDNCACLLQPEGMPIEGTFIVYANGNTKFIANAGGVETLNPDPAMVQSKCCKQKPFSFCKGCYDGQTGIFFYMDDYTVNFIDDDNPTNIVMNIDRSKIECNGCDTDPCCCYEQGLVKIVHDQQVRAPIITLPAGSYNIEIRVDSAEPGAFIIINGVTYLFNDQYNPRVQVNEVNNIQDFLPEVIIENPGGFSFEYTALYPSNTLANLTSI